MAGTGAAVPIECSDQPLDLSFHPSRPSLLAAALVDGTIEVHDFAELLEERQVVVEDEDDEIDTILSSTKVHTQLLASNHTESGSKLASARCVAFSSDGSAIYTGGTVGDLACLDAERVSSFSTNTASAIKWRFPLASTNKSPLQLVRQLDDPNLLATGDEAGGVRIFDVRTCSAATPEACVFSWKEHEDYISGIECSRDGNTLLASSADCTLSVYDLRKDQPKGNKERFLRRSDDQEDELLSIKIIKNGRKVVCGTGEGVLAVWSWGTWGDVSDRFPGHPASVDALLMVDEDTLLTGSSDGLIRVVSIHPDKLLGVLGDHEGFPIEKLQMNSDRSFVGSVTHDNIIRLWDARVLGEDFNDDGEEMKMDAEAQTSGNGKDKNGSDDEWEDMDAGLDADSEDSNDTDDSDEKPRSKNDKRAGRLKSENEKFFEDL